MRIKQQKPLPTSSMSRRHSKREATAALHFWQALEYLAPQKAPKVDRKELVWKIAPGEAEQNMPWRNPAILAILDAKRRTFKHQDLRWRFQLFCGIVSGAGLVEAARLALGAPAGRQRVRSEKPTRPEQFGR